ncbi:hypothetical protein [Psychromonas aquimarina]|uniref:hypothetical protein n=1 Tax=Psychromonas aquimarina TaxID=444919 RepID=UPI00146FA1B9|nr:hypothetical protein [Psychromonas aquimarina]
MLLPPSKIRLDLTGNKSNLLSLFATSAKLAQQFDVNQEEVLHEIRSGDYDNAVKVINKYFGEHVEILQ